MPSFAATERGYANLWAKAELSPGKRADAEKVARRIIANRKRYEAVAEKTGVPWAWIGAIHDREAGGSFTGVLHNGDKIIGTGRKTYRVPKGRGPFSSWEKAAVDALKLKDLHKITDWSFARMLYEAERFNGQGYFGKRVNSPYLWAATSLQQPGKYIDDHTWSPTAWDQQLGVAAVMKALLEIEPTIFSRSDPPAAPVIAGSAGSAAVIVGSALQGAGPVVIGAVTAAVVILAAEGLKTAKGKAMLDFLLKNWKTSSAGGGVILASVWTLLQTYFTTGALDPTLLGQIIVAVLGGFGLIASKDANVTGGTKQQ
jgi:lysozyme family protein